MNVTHKIKIHLDDQRLLQPIDAVQGDAYTRKLEFSLYAEGKAWEVPEGVTPYVTYRGSGGAGIYCDLNGEPAYEVDGNVITVTLIPQVVAVPGVTAVNVMLRDENDKQLSTFSVMLRVAPNPGVGAGKPEDYFDIRQWVGVGPLVVTMTLTSGAKVGTADHTHADILSAHNAGRGVICSINGKIVLPLTNINNSVAIFQGPNAGGTDRQVRFSPAWGKEAQVSDVEYASKSDLSDYAKTTDLTGYVQTGDLDPYAKKTDLKSYAKSADLKPPLYVTLTRPDSGKNWPASHSYGEIQAAHDEKRNVMCVLDGRTVVPLIHLTSTTATFQGPATDGTDCKVIMPSFWDKLAQVSVVKYAFEDDLAAYALARNVTDESFFDIDADGVISLKAEYKGSKMAELPEVVIIPQNIDGEEVSGFEEGMFCGNTRVKEIVIPSTVKVLPDHFAKEAIHLEKLTNTEQLEAIGAGALQQTRISELVCPNLKALSSEACWQAYCLQYADLGKITGIPENAFKHCENLQEVKADHVTSIGKHSFYGTRRLKSLSCLPNVKSIGDGAFWSSRCDLEALPADCAFGNLSSYKQFNPTEYWKGVSFTPCKVPLGSLFSQYDPRWADEEIKYTADDGTEYAYLDDNGNPCTYAENGCALFTLMAIYSAFTGTTFNDPKAFFPVLENAGMLGKDFRKHSTWIEIANGLGFETELVTVVTSESCQKIYDALQGGALLYRSTVGGIPGDDFINAGIATNVLAQGTHAMLGYGINSDGEMLTSDTAMHGHKVGIYENHKTAWHIYKHGSELCDCVIVRKPK